MSFKVNWSAALAGILFTVSAAHAQDDLVGLASSDPNRFVSEVQQALQNAGGYTGDVSGILDQRTITAINAACRTAGVLAQCQLGPLSPAGAIAVVQAVTAKDVAEDDAVAAEEVDVAMAAPADAEPSAVVPTPGLAATKVEWQQTSSGNGIEISVEEKGAVYTAVAVGIAGDADWTNIVGSSVVGAVAGQTWTFSLTASADLAPHGTATARIAAFSADEYIGELSSGAVIVGSEPKEYVVAGQVPEGAVRLVPYIQLRYPQGTAVEDTVTISDASIAPAS